MKDESGITKDIEQVAKEFRLIRVKNSNEDCFIRYAKFHLKQVRIAVLKARLEECDHDSMLSAEEEYIKDLEAQLAEAEKGEGNDNRRSP